MVSHLRPTYHGSTTLMQWVTTPNKKANMLNSLKYKLSRIVLGKIYLTFVRPLLEYCDVVWSNCTERESELIDNVQYKCTIIVSGAMTGTSRAKVSHELGWESLKCRRDTHKLCLFYKMVFHLVPNYLWSLLPPPVNSRTTYFLRNATHFCVIV